MIVENKGGKGNPYHDEEGKFTTAGTGNVSEAHIDYTRDYKQDLEENSELGSKVLGLLGVSNIDEFLNTLDSMKEQSPKTYDKVCKFLDDFIENNGGKIEYKDLESMTDEELDKEIEHHLKFFDDNNFYCEVNNTEKTGLMKNPYHNWSYWLNGFQEIRFPGTQADFNVKKFKNKRNFVAFSRGIEEAFKKFSNFFGKNNKNNNIVLSVVGGTHKSGAYCGYMCGNKKAKIFIGATGIARMEATKIASLDEEKYDASNGRKMSFINTQNCNYVMQAGAHEMGHALEHCIIDKIFPDNPSLKTDLWVRDKCMGDVASVIAQQTVKAYMDEKQITNEYDALGEIVGSVSQYAKTNIKEWFAECIGGIVAKKEENYLPAEKYLLKVLQDKDFIEKIKNNDELSKYAIHPIGETLF